MAREGDICPACGTARLKLVSGNKNGRKWAALFCSDRSCVQPPEWIKDRAAPAPKPNGATALPQATMPLGINPEAEVRLRAATEAVRASVGAVKERLASALALYQFQMAAYRGKLPEATQGDSNVGDEIRGAFAGTPSKPGRPADSSWVAEGEDIDPWQADRGQ